MLKLDQTSDMSWWEDGIYTGIRLEFTMSDNNLPVYGVVYSVRSTFQPGAGY